MRDLCRCFPKDKLVCFAATGPEYEVGVSTPELSWIPMLVRNLPTERTAAAGRSASTLDCLRRLSKMKRELDPLIDEAVRYATDQKVEQIWSPLAGPAMVHMARVVTERLKLPLIPIVWDPLEYVSESRGYDRITRQLIMEEFAATLSLSRCCGVASEGMKEILELRHELHCEVLINSIDRHLWVDRGSGCRNGEEFVIGFAGSIYAKTELQAVIDALTSVGWKLEGKAIRLRIFGNAMSMDLHALGKRCCIEFLGHRPTAEAVEELSKADLAYLPYWLQEKYSIPVRQSFPNKLATYLAAGCPVFYHGPEDSSPIRFMERYPVGVSCNSLQAEVILAALARIIADEPLRESIAQARKLALNEELNSTVFQSRFAALLGVNASEFVLDGVSKLAANTVNNN